MSDSLIPNKGRDLGAATSPQGIVGISIKPKA